MNTYNFDQNSSNYAAALGYHTPDYYVQEKVKILKRIMKQLDARGRVLDVGCGPGWAVRALAGSCKEIIGVDPAKGMITGAGPMPPNASLRVADGKNLPFEESAFDLVFSFCILHHLSEEDLPKVLAEQARVLRPGGLVINFDHNPLNPVVVRRVKNCPIDEGAVLRRRSVIARAMKQAGLSIQRKRYVIFFPESLSFLSFLDPYLGQCPLGGQYYVMGRKS